MISTGTGDEGYTSLLDGRRVPKSDEVIEAGGQLDEANAFLGAARAFADDDRLKGILREIQEHLVRIGTEISCSDSSTVKVCGVSFDGEIRKIEGFISYYEKKIQPGPHFVVIGENFCSSFLNIARTVVRRAERNICRLFHQGSMKNKGVLVYMNRLSDLLCRLADMEERKEGGS